MDAFRVLEIKKSVFENNDRQADLLREELKRNHTFLLNLMSSPGSGKTTTLMATINALKDDLRIGVMEADIDSDVDAATISTSGAKVIQLHTGGMCHLDAGMTRQGLEGLGTENIDLAILENVGNLVCPAEFDTGAVKNAMISMVESGLGICIAHELVLRSDHHNVVVRPLDPPAHRTIAMAIPPESEGKPLVRTFAAFVRAWAQANP